MRVPSVHIREDQLKLIIKRVLSDEENIPEDLNYDTLVKSIIHESKKHSANGRSILVTNDKLQKAAKRLLIADTGDALLMAKIILMVRKSLKHRGIQMIKEGSRDWGMVREIAGAAVDFANDFELDKGEAFKQYIFIGLKKMTKFTLNKFLSMHDGICEVYESNLLIARDNTKHLTDIAYNTYNELIIRNTGTAIFNYREMPEKFKFFILAKQEAESHGIHPRTYIESQFYGFSWKNAIPDPAQLIGPKAIERLQKYVFEKGIKSTINTNINTEKVNAFKNLRDGNNRSK